MRKAIITTISLTMFCAAVSAQDLALISSQIINDPVNLATAGAASASSKNISMAAFGNAAAMAFHEGTGDIQVSYERWAPAGITSSRISFGEGMRLGKTFCLSIAGVYGMGQDYEIIDDRGVPSGSFKTSDMMIGAGVGIAASPNFGIGLNFRFANEKLYDDASVKAVMIDGSLMYHKDGLNISAGLRSLGPKVKDHSENEFSIPGAANIAAYYDIAPSEEHSIGFGADGNYFFNGGISFAAGAQYAWKDMVFARAGYHYGSKDAPLPQYLSLGLGAKYYGVSINLSYLTLNKAIGNTLALSLGYSF